MLVPYMMKDGRKEGRKDEPSFAPNSCWRSADILKKNQADVIIMRSSISERWRKMKKKKKNQYSYC